MLQSMAFSVQHVGEQHWQGARFAEAPGLAVRILPLCHAQSWAEPTWFSASENRAGP